MKQVKPSIELKTLLDNYKVSGGAIEYVLMESDNVSNESADLHHQAALLFIETMKCQSDDYFEKLTKSIATRALGWMIGLSAKREDYFQLTYDINKAFSCEIGLNVFLGYRYCKEQGLPFPEEAWDDDKGEYSGYWYPFSEPPYGMNVMPHEKRLLLFHQINELLFGGLNVDLEIHEWSTEWSNYFDAGHEWWGSYLWTVHVRGTNRWVALGASQTD